MDNSSHEMGQVHANPKFAEYDPAASQRQLKTPVFDVLSPMEKAMWMRQFARDAQRARERDRRWRWVWRGVVGVLVLGAAVWIYAAFLFQMDVQK